MNKIHTPIFSWTTFSFDYSMHWSWHCFDKCNVTTFISIRTYKNILPRSRFDDGRVCSCLKSSGAHHSDFKVWTLWWPVTCKDNVSVSLEQRKSGLMRWHDLFPLLHSPIFLTCRKMKLFFSIILTDSGFLKAPQLFRPNPLCMWKQCYFLYETL